ncbi:2Fe-2S iron-sulfur cluster-binding protein [Hoeflea alexandrii]|uniref:2Fe-2S iron-sulfur cluster-binding protein n=1 Tax=Hoeflea alexandrii TaxID=288436 RepID=UPI0022AF13D4|nr:2Fe-2S iron-sulfur cluster-binding protein [Hoeflea alexandrii]MCZ4292226.1 2Fe-2S iron-sulfur cluster-binding protein [Hoeflea alexandrii]
MIAVTFVLADGSEVELAGQVGQTVMELGRNNGIPGIIAECGGAAMCATCHVYVDESDLDRAGSVGEIEEEMLDMTVAPRLPRSRLSCQIRLTPEMTGLRVHIPEAS